MSISQEGVYQKLSEIVSPFLKEKSDIGMDSHLINDLALDSIDLVDIILEIEMAFGVNIRDNDINSFKVVRDMVNFIDARINVQ